MVGSVVEVSKVLASGAKCKNIPLIWYTGASFFFLLLEVILLTMMRPTSL